MGEVRADMVGGGERTDAAVGFRRRGILLLERFVGEWRADIVGGGGRIPVGERVRCVWVLCGWEGEVVCVGGRGNCVRG